MDLKSELDKLGIWYRFIDKSETVHTADAAEATGIPLHRITKNLISETNRGDRVLLIIPGDKRVNLRAAARALDVSNVKLFPFKDAHKVSGYPPGGTPSVGLKDKLHTVVDTEISLMETFFCGGGSTGKLLELRSDEVLRISEAIVAPITE